MIFGDYDNDSDMDMVLMGIGDYLRTYTNNGTTFVQSQQESSGGFNELGGGLYGGSIAFGDYNNDGFLDFVGIGLEQSRDAIYKNNGSAMFSRDNLADADFTGDNFQQGAIVWNDLDIDNDLDLITFGTSVATNDFQAKIYISNSSLSSNNTIPTAPINFSNSTLSNGNVFLSWGNGSDNQTNSNGLYYNLRVGTTSAGNQIVSGIYGGSSGGEGWGGGPSSGYFGNMMQRKNISLKASRFQVGVTYYWSVQTIDTALAKSEWSTEKTFTLTSDFIPPTITLNAPADNLVTNLTSIMFNATVVDDYNLTNVTLYGNWSGGWHSDTTNSSGINNTNYIFSNNLTEGTHLWGIRACDNTANCIGTNQTFRIDITYPIVNLISPTNGSSWTTANVVNFTYNVSDLEISNCSLIINGLTNLSNTSILVNQTQNFTTNLPNGNYNWSIRCVDQANNVNFTGNYSLTVSYTAPVDTSSPGSSSSGGGGSASGGGLSTTTSSSETSVISNVIANTPVEVKLAKAASIGIESIMITPTENAANVKVIITKLANQPNGTISVDSEVLSYLEIKAEALENKLSQAVINFQVNKSLLDEKNIKSGDVVLKRYVNGEWIDLKTEFIHENRTKVYYKAISPGLSYFAIASKTEKVLVGKESKQLGEEEIEESQLPTEEPSEEQIVNKDKPTYKNIFLWLIPVTILILISSIVIYIKTRSKSKKKLAKA